MSRTTKPCPGCGEVDPRRKPDTICQDCRKRLSDAAAVLATADRERRREHQLYRADHPGFYDRGYDFLGGDFDGPKQAAEYALRDAFNNLVACTTDPTTSPNVPDNHYGGVRTLGASSEDDPVLYLKPSGRKKGSDSDNSAFFSLRQRLFPETAHAINRLDDCVRAALKSAYAKGVRDGRDLIGQIAAGKVSVADFNEIDLADEDNDG